MSSWLYRALAAGVGAVLVVGWLFFALPQQVTVTEQADVLSGQEFRWQVRDLATAQVTVSEPRPQGMTWSATTGELIWVPDREQAGDHRVTLAVVRERLNVDVELKIHVIPAEGPASAAKGTP